MLSGFYPLVLVLCLPTFYLPALKSTRKQQRSTSIGQPTTASTASFTSPFKRVYIGPRTAQYKSSHISRTTNPSIITATSTSQADADPEPPSLDALMPYVNNEGREDSLVNVDGEDDETPVPETGEES